MNRMSMAIEAAPLLAAMVCEGWSVIASDDLTVHLSKRGFNYEAYSLSIESLMGALTAYGRQDGREEILRQMKEIK